MDNSHRAFPVGIPSMDGPTRSTAHSANDHRQCAVDHFDCVLAISIPSPTSTAFPRMATRDRPIARWVDESRRQSLADAMYEKFSIEALSESLVNDGIHTGKRQGPGAVPIAGAHTTIWFRDGACEQTLCGRPDAGIGARICKPIDDVVRRLCEDDRWTGPRCVGPQAAAGVA